MTPLNSSWVGSSCCWAVPSCMPGGRKGESAAKGSAAAAWRKAAMPKMRKTRPIDFTSVLGCQTHPIRSSCARGRGLMNQRRRGECKLQLPRRYRPHDLEVDALPNLHVFFPVGIGREENDLNIERRFGIFREIDRDQSGVNTRVLTEQPAQILQDRRQLFDRGVVGQADRLVYPALRHPAQVRDRLLG